MLLAVGAVAHLKLLQDIIAETSATEVGQTYGFAIGRVVQLVLEPVAGPFVHNEHTVAVVARFQLLFCEFLLLNLNAVFLGQITQCIGVGELFVLHDEVNRTSSLAAGKAFAQILGRRYHKGWRSIVMEGAQPFQVYAGTFQCHKVRHHIHNVCRIQYLIYR